MSVSEKDTTDIAVSALDGSDLRRLTNDNAVDAHPAWSPDGTQIAFLSTRKSSYPAMHLYVMDSDGSNVRSLAPSTKTRGHPPVWSPDGDHIAFVAYVRTENIEEYEFRYVVRTVSSDGSNQMEFGETISNPAWSPDGGRIAFMKTDGETHGLYVVGADGSDPRTLISFDGQSLWYDTLSWSPDGREILYGRGGYFTLVAIDETGDKAKTVARFHEIVEPGGTTIVAVDEASGESVTVAAEFPTPAGEVRNPKVATIPVPKWYIVESGGAAWSLDGSRIAFYANPFQGSDVVLYTTASDGSDWRALVKGKRVVIED